MISSKLTAIPEELKQWNQWIVWRPVERNGKATKMPISVINGTPASTTDPETWVSFERAAGYIAANHDFNLGFVFSESDPFIGIDFDNIIEEGTPVEWARAGIHRIGSYAEVSPSGNGVKVWLNAPEFQGWKGKNSQDIGRLGAYGNPAGLEMYCQGRFFAVTGAIFEGLDTIQEREDIARKTKSAFFPESPAPTQSVIGGGSPMRPADFDIDDATLRASQWAAYRDPAIQGSGGDAWTNETISFVVHGFFLTPEEACVALGAWNQGCMPPWEWNQFIKKAQRCSAWNGGWDWIDQAGNEVGYKNRELYGDQTEWTAANQAQLDGFVESINIKEDPEEKPAAPPADLSILDIPPFGEVPELDELDIAPTPLIRAIVDWSICIGTKPVPIFGLAAAVGAIAPITARRVLTPTNDKTIIYQLVLGATGGGKDTARKVAKALLEASCSTPPLLEKATAVSIVEKELMEIPSILHMMDEFGEKVENEIYTKRSKSENFDWKSFWLTRYSGEDAYIRNSSGRIRICHPSLHLMGITTPERLFNAGGMSAIVDGFLNRFICFADDFATGRGEFIKSDLSNMGAPIPDVVRDWFSWWQRIPEPRAMPEDFIEGLDEYSLAASPPLTEPILRCHWGDGVQEIAQLYRDYCDQRGGDMKAAYARCCQNALRLAVLCACTEVKPERPSQRILLEMRHFKWGVKIVEHSAACLLRLWESNQGETREARGAFYVKEMLRQAGADGKSRSKINQTLLRKFSLSAKQSKEVLQTLKDADLVADVLMPTKGRPATFYYLKEHAPEGANNIHEDNGHSNGAVIKSITFD